jgi:uncharacterized protein (DUF1499 family)
MRYGAAMRNVIGIVAALSMAIGPLLSHFQVTPPLGGFAFFALGGLVATLTGLVSVVQAVRGKGLGTGGALGLVAGGLFLFFASKGAGTPRINDFTTDLADPPAYVAAATLPQNAGRDLSYPKDFAAIQRECCADLQPATLSVPPAAAYARVVKAAQAMPAWKVTRDDAEATTLEAVATSALFRFQDDVVIRVRPASDGGARVDMRSKSRDGKGDIGANTKRIHDFMGQIEATK